MENSESEERVEFDLNATYILTDVYNWLKSDEMNYEILMKTPEILTGFKIERVGYSNCAIFNDEICINFNELQYFSIKNENKNIEILNINDTYILTDIIAWLKCDEFNYKILILHPELLTGFKLSEVSTELNGFYIPWIFNLQCFSIKDSV